MMEQVWAIWQALVTITVTMKDAGVMTDAGVTTDAGVMADAGVMTDGKH